LKTFNYTLKVIFILFAVVITADSLYAKVYKWIDENGVMHFTDNKSFIPEKYLRSAKEFKLGSDSGDENEEREDVSHLKPIEFKKDEDGFEGLPFGTSIADFLRQRGDTKPEQEKGDVKSYVVGDGQRRMWDIKLKVLYSFNNGSFDQVRIFYDKNDEKRFLKKLRSRFGEPDFEKFPFSYWFYDKVEFRVRKDEDCFYVLEKKIKKF
jgi:hypothetical protein